MNVKLTFTHQNDFLEFVDNFGYDDDRLNELIEEIKINNSPYTNSYSSLDDMRRDQEKILKERCENYYKLTAEVMEILKNKNPSLFVEKYNDYFDSKMPTGIKLLKDFDNLLNPKSLIPFK